MVVIRLKNKVIIRFDQKKKEPERPKKLSSPIQEKRNEIHTYKITPHSSVANNQNYRLFRVLHKLYETYDGRSSRTTRDGLRFTIREKDSIWYDVIFRQVDGKKQAEFYVSTTALWSKKFCELLQNNMKVSVEPAGRDVLKLPDRVLLHDIRLARHDIFSLQTNASEQTTPISSIMTALDDIMDDGDYARLSVCMETVNRRKWIKQAEWAREKIMKGNVPQRAKWTREKAGGAAKRAFMTVAAEVYDVINDTFEVLSTSIFKSARPKTSKNHYRAALMEEIHSTRLSDRSLRKMNQPVFRTHIRVATYAKEDLRAELTANTISSAFSELGGDNELIPFKINFKRRKDEVIKELNTLHLSKKSQIDGDVSLLSCDEISKVALMMPTAAIQQQYEEALTVNKKMQTVVPEVLKAEKGILIGHVEEEAVSIPTDNPDNTFKGYVFQGGMGQGKDVSLQNFVVEGVMSHGMSFVVIDQVNKEGRKGMANGIRDSLPADKIIDLDFSNPDYIPPLDLTEVMRKLDRRGIDRFANELIDFFDVADMTQTKALLRVAAKASGGSLLETKRIVENDEYRLQVAAELAESNPLLAHELNQLGEKVARNKVDPILSRLDDFFGDSTLNYIFSQQPHPDMDFEKWMREGKAIILRVPDRHLSTVNVRILVHWITLKVLMTRLLMTNEDQSNGAFMVFNEPQTYLNDGLSKLIARIATQGRKERLGCLIACQYFEQLGSLQKDLTGGGVNWLLFRNGDRKVYDELKHRLESHVTVEEALETEKYHALCLFSFGDKPQPPCLVRMLPPSYERLEAYDNSFLTLRHARQYGRHYLEIEKALIEAL